MLKTSSDRWVWLYPFCRPPSAWSHAQVQGTTYNGRPDVVPGVSWRLTGEDRQALASQTGDASYLDPSLRWYNPRAFSTVDVNSGRTGNAGRNVLVGPSLVNLDANLSKRFHLPL